MHTCRDNGCLPIADPAFPAFLRTSPADGTGHIQDITIPGQKLKFLYFPAFTRASLADAEVKLPLTDNKAKI
jgi:hypothetical protein